MRHVRSITRYIARWGIWYEPRAEKVEVHLFESDCGDYFVRLPWACVNAVRGPDTTDDQMAAILGSPHVTAEEALAWATHKAPFWHKVSNQKVLTRLHDAIRWDGDLCGPWNLADKMLVTKDELYALARGEKKATRKQADLAMAYHGRPV